MGFGMRLGAYHYLTMLSRHRTDVEVTFRHTGSVQ